MAQVISRMQLTWLGQPGPSGNTRPAFTVIVMLVAAFFVYSIALDLAALPYNINTTPSYMAILRLSGNFLFTFWSIYALCRTRQSVRARYQIPEQTCQGCEDVCCAVWCGCCATSQMLRHTGEYETYPGVYFSPTGHPPGVPLVV
jgi:Cys-rich protein (TIGR01571 family)